MAAGCQPRKVMKLGKLPVRFSANPVGGKIKPNANKERINSYEPR